jgi:nucleotide-binding universal stress UspA family protein
MFSNLIVPLDGSPEAAEALHVARSLAHLTAGRIVLLRVTDEPGTVEARGYLAEVAADLESGGVSVSCVVEQGDAATRIERAARAQHADAIVMVTHGRSGVARKVLGSVAERLLTHGSVPLLLLRRGTRPLGQLRNMLVPLDGSPGAAVALGMAVALARASGAQLILSQVVEPIPHYAYVENYVDPSWDEEAERAADVYVQGLAARLHRLGVHVEGHAVLAPHVAEQLSAEAERTDADLVIMSTHAHRGVARALLGSVADGVVRSANRPVLLVHQHSRARLPVHDETGTAPAVTTSE